MELKNKKNREVHHHPQLEQKPKPSKAYFLEYIKYYGRRVYRACDSSFSFSVIVRLTFIYPLLIV